MLLSAVAAAQAAKMGYGPGGVGGARLECECHQILRGDGCSDPAGMEDLQVDW
ncbi:acyl-CoA N-acyltransferases (NAT) superfamily protein [Actinidia rufa]|uniref:Acyl-CoA N-acyltransferases (NAT) superfamily protein n=1 Tax=Actinidia rufa TaxID=165716 RepID=A0A7J0DIV7_9ERIC|nr:acyl-CoA N-acyltransferases (NAT) superfamily protein [Actinidia rufa]